MPEDKNTTTTTTAAATATAITTKTVTEKTKTTVTTDSPPTSPKRKTSPTLHFPTSTLQILPPLPPYITLPLLTGLYRRFCFSNPQEKSALSTTVSTNPLLSEALSTFQKATAPPKKFLFKKCTSPPASLHYLFRSLLSPSLRVRRMTCKILIHNLASSKDDRFLLRDLVLQLIHNLVNTGKFPSTIENNDPCVQLFGMLGYLIFDSLSSSLGDKKSNSGGKKKRKRGEKNGGCIKGGNCSWGMESFVSSGGLRWVAFSIVNIVDVLASLDGEGGLTEKHADEISLSTRLTLLIDLLARLILQEVPQCENKGSKLRIYNHFWTTSLPSVDIRGVILSPLAALILSYEVLKDMVKVRSLERSLGLLKQILDPKDASVSSARTSPHIRSSSRDLANMMRKRQRLGLSSTGVLSVARLAGGDEPSILFGGDGGSGVERMEAVELEEDCDEDNEDEEIDDEDEDEDDDEDDDEEDDDDDEDEEEDEEEEDCEEMIVCDDHDEEIESCCDQDEEDEHDEDDSGDEETHNQDEPQRENPPPESSLHCEDEDHGDTEDEDEADVTNTTTPLTAAKKKTSLIPPPTLQSRNQTFLYAGIQILSSQHLPVHPLIDQHRVLTPSSQRSLLQSLCNIVSPPPKPLSLKLFLRRAPTQEEFFRGSLTKNPISISTLETKEKEPLVRDLRTHIAKDLQMSDSAELLELLVANKILDCDLNLRVVQQSLWKKHVLGNSSSDFSNVEDVMERLPPMVVTYRLAGVDGEATEDKIAPKDLSDPLSDKTNQNPNKQFEITTILTEGKGVSVLLKSVEEDISDWLRRIRRDDVSGRNGVREEFEKRSPGPALLLLKFCANVKANQRKMVHACAPSLLLRLLLEVLNTIDAKEGKSKENPTMEALQELIEILASDISTDSETEGLMELEEQEDASLPLLLNSLRESSLSSELRKVIANLLPFLTNGQVSSSKALAEEFLAHIQLPPPAEENVLLDTFLQCAMNLPAVAVCNTFREQLLSLGFVQFVTDFVRKDMPPEPPSSIPALFPNTTSQEKKYDEEWKLYFSREGLHSSLKILIGLCSRHVPTQSFIASQTNLLKGLHWMENANDSTMMMDMKNLGLLAETLLDALLQENQDVKSQIQSLRQTTKSRKKKIAEERRSRALVGMSNFGPLAGSGIHKTLLDQNKQTLASRIGMSFAAIANTSRQKITNVIKTASLSPSSKPLPTWLAEMEDLEDEEGYNCAVCQEGRTLQPTELLGLYAFVKKVAIPHNKNGFRSSIDGTQLLLSLPPSLPDFLVGTDLDEKCFRPARSAALNMTGSSSGGSASTLTSRPSHYITTVTAGNAIHCSCHARARQADRNHPKAPKSEWEGASLRNSRVTCNIILPLVSQSSEVPLVSVESALAEHQAVVSNMLGARPKSMLWTVLHDVRLLVLRISYGEALNIDCGGGSLTSNISLIFQLFFLADMLERDTEHDSPVTTRHAKHLSGAFLTAMEILCKKEGTGTITMQKAVADAAPMAGICCVLFFNGKYDGEMAMTDVESVAELEPSKKRRWLVYRDLFFRGLVRCAGKRYGNGVDDSGCTSGKSSKRNKTSRVNSFRDWDMVDATSGDDLEPTVKSMLVNKERFGAVGNNLEEYASALRPMITFFILLDKLSEDYVSNLKDAKMAAVTDRLVGVIEECQKITKIVDLVQKANVNITKEEVLADFGRGRKPH